MSNAVARLLALLGSWAVAAAVVGLVLLLCACALRLAPTPLAPGGAAGPAASGGATVPVAGDDLPTLRANLAQAQAKLAAAESAVRAQERERAERPLRSLLTWSQWAGGALALLSVVALGLTFSPWGSWIPGGRTTALVGIGTGAGTILTARSLAAALDLAWLPWVLLACGVAAALTWVVWLVIRETAAHGDRIEPATTPEQIAASKAVSAAAQTRHGVRGLINLARGKLGTA